MKNFGPVPNKDWEYLFLSDKIHPKFRILFFVFRYIYGYKENRMKGYFTVRRLQDLAAYLRMHRKMLWKYLKQLEDDGIIWRKGKRIGIGSWSEFFRYVPTMVTKEELPGSLIVHERVTEFPEYRDNVPERETNQHERVPDLVANERETEKYVPITGTKPDHNAIEYRENLQNIPPDLRDGTDIEEEEEDFSEWTKKELFGKFYPYRRFFPDGIDHPEKIDEYFINVILPEITKHFPGYTFNPANPNLKAFFREYEKILRLKVLSPRQTKITM